MNVDGQDVGLVAAIATALGLFVKMKPWVRDERKLDTEAKIEGTIRESMLAEIEQLQALAAQVNPLKNLLALKDTRMQSIALMLADIREDLCNQCRVKNARSIERIGVHLDQLTPATKPAEAKPIARVIPGEDEVMTAFSGIDYATERRQDAEK